MLDGGGTPVLLGNARWIGPGGESVRQGEDGDIMIFHAYDGKTGDAYLQLSTIDWTGGWPHVALEGGNPATNSYLGSLAEFVPGSMYLENRPLFFCSLLFELGGDLQLLV